MTRWEELEPEEGVRVAGSHFPGMTQPLQSGTAAGLTCTEPTQTHLIHSLF